MSKESFPTGPLHDAIRREITEEIDREKDAEIAKRDTEIKKLKDQNEALAGLHVKQDENVHEQYVKGEKSRAETMVDELTGLANRKAFVKKIEELTAVKPEVMGHERRKRVPITYLALDLDKFKAVNDTYGHAGGNAVLQQTAAFLKKLGRGMEDVAYRFHGDEFGMVFMNVTPEQLIARFRAAEGEESAEEPAGEAKLPFTAELPSLPNAGEKITLDVTMSAGLVEVTPGARLEEILKRGDDALYDAKRAGRNKIMIYKRNTVDEEDEVPTPSA